MNRCSRNRCAAGTPAATSAQPEDMTGRYVQRGELLGYVLTEAETVRVVVPQSSLERIHRSLEGVRVRLVQDAGREFEARVLREVPSATDELPSMALSLQGGGSIGWIRASRRKGGPSRRRTCSSWTCNCRRTRRAVTWARASCEVLPRAPADRVAGLRYGAPDGAAPAKTLMEETHPAALRASPQGATDRHSRIRVALVVTVLPSCDVPLRGYD